MAEEKKSTKLNRSTLKKALKLYRFVKPYRAEFLLGLVFLLFSSAATLAFPKFLGDLVDSAQEADFIDRIRETLMLLLGILVAQAIASFFRVVLFVNVTEKSLASLRQHTYKHLIKLPVSFFNKRRVGELNSRISADISTLQETFTTTLAEFVRQLVIIIGGVAILLISSPRLTLFMLAIVPVIVVIAVIFGRFIRRYSKTVQREVGESNVIVEETMQGILNVKAFANEFLEITRYTKKTNQVAKTGMKGGKYRGAFSSFIVLGLFGAIVAVVWQGANLIATGELKAGELFSFILYSGFIGGSIGGFANVYSNIQKAIGATEELLEILDEETEEIDESASDQNLPDFKGSIRFKEVHFSYPSRPDLPVIKDLSFEAKPGQQIALVGSSGAGKSTVVNLLLRFYEVANGSLTFDNKEAKDYSVSVLRNQMAVVPQDVFLFGGSIRENILYGRPNADEKEIIESAKQANAWEFIQRFPNGLDTVVGERGIQLSGGQRQRIAIARAVLKNPKILILDEATSSLDAESERLVQEALDTLMKGRTSIVIAHRLATIRKADKILVLENGQIRESGTHQELLEVENGLYQSLSKLQFTQ
jgi:ABC transporter fused permease/ATP-binding protein